MNQKCVPCCYPTKVGYGPQHWEHLLNCWLDVGANMLNTPTVYSRMPWHPFYHFVFYCLVFLIWNEMCCINEGELCRRWRQFLSLLLQVKDQKEYEFNPAKIVMDICKIYVHLHESDSFCLAVSQDGRSYSPHLFTYAEDVLGKLYEYLLRISQIQISASHFFCSAKQMPG